MWANFHSHTRYCDGKHTITELVEHASRNKMPSLGISSHAPLPNKLPWCMHTMDLPQYIKEIANAKANNRDVEVYAGLEVDYISGIISPSQFRGMLDYTIGSIHFVGGSPEEALEIDGSHDKFTKKLNELYQGNFMLAATEYMEATREMITKSEPDIVGHLDKIKIQNLSGNLFNENDSWWRNEVEKTLRVIALHDSILEVNTRGIYQKKSQTTYPSPWILEIARKMNIRITLSSDAHVKTDLTEEFGATAGMLMQLGFKEIHILSGGKWIPRQFNEHGLVR